MSDMTSHKRGRTTWLTATLIVLGCALAGCGQKGKLYLPNQKKQVPPVTQPDSPPQSAQPQPLPAPDAR